MCTSSPQQHRQGHSNAHSNDDSNSPSSTTTPTREVTFRICTAFLVASVFALVVGEDVFHGRIRTSVGIAATGSWFFGHAAIRKVGPRRRNGSVHVFVRTTLVGKIRVRCANVFRPTPCSTFLRVRNRASTNQPSIRTLGAIRFGTQTGARADCPAVNDSLQLSVGFHCEEGQ